MPIRPVKETFKHLCLTVTKRPIPCHYLKSEGVNNEQEIKEIHGFRLHVNNIFIWSSTVPLWAIGIGTF